MPVGTRSTFGPVSTSLPHRHGSGFFGHDHGEGGHNAEHQQQEQQQLSPREMQMAALRQAAAMASVQLDSAKKVLSRLSPGASPGLDAPRPRGTPKPRRTTAGPNAGTSSSSRPRASSVGRKRDEPSQSPRSSPRPRASSKPVRCNIFEDEG